MTRISSHLPLAGLLRGYWARMEKREEWKSKNSGVDLSFVIHGLETNDRKTDQLKAIGVKEQAAEKLADWFGSMGRNSIEGPRITGDLMEKIILEQPSDREILEVLGRDGLAMRSKQDDQGAVLAQRLNGLPCVNEDGFLNLRRDDLLPPRFWSNLRAVEAMPRRAIPDLIEGIDALCVKIFEKTMDSSGELLRYYEKMTGGTFKARYYIEKFRNDEYLIIIKWGDSIIFKNTSQSLLTNNDLNVGEAMHRLLQLK